MDFLANRPQVESGSDGVPDGVDERVSASGAELRAAPRFTLLIRAATLVTASGEFVCVLRDVSETGVSVRLFHRPPTGNPVELHMPGGEIYQLRLVWERNQEAGYEFAAPVDVARLINEAGQYPKRGLRLGVAFPIKIRTLAGIHDGVVENLSQQGARFECETLFAIDQSLHLESSAAGADFFDIRAKVRWRREREYGVVFDDTKSLPEFARLAARIQCPRLLD